MEAKLFYDFFQINYYDYIQISLLGILDGNDPFSLNKKILNYSKKDYETAIKSQIRQTYFHSIETLFELIFALCPNNKQYVDDENILKIISAGKFNYDKIHSIASKENGLEFLDELLFINTKKTTLANYIFYYGLYESEIQEQINNSVKIIKEFLKLVATDFSDRREYNSYKHGLRIMQIWNEMVVSEKELGTPLFKLDLSDLMTFYHKNREDDAEEFISKPLDYIRDSKMTSFVSYLIYNIIDPRKLYFSKSKEKREIFLFNENAIKDLSRVNVKATEFKVRISSNTTRPNR